MPKPRIMLADDHEIVIEGLRRVLAASFEIVGVVSDGRELVEKTEELRPDLVLLDISMPSLNGIDAAHQIKKRMPSTKLVFLTHRADRDYVHAAFRAGASGYLVKQSLVSEMQIALDQVLQGRYYVSAHLAKGVPFERFNPNRNPSELFGESLTARQREVLQLIAEGKTAKEIAAALKISPKTVEFHKAGIMEELGVRTTAELTRYALEHGLVE